MTYLNLAEIGDVIRNGEDIQVEDHEKKVDITAQTMTLIIAHNEQARLSKPVNKNLIHRIIMSGGLTQYANTLEKRISL